MNPLKRVRYFTGQLLTTDDFVTEQDYFLEKHRRHNRHLHGYGVVCGLEISTDGVTTINITPGMAIDCRGQEITVSGPVESRLPEAGDIAYLTLRYVEKETGPVPAAGGPVSEEQDAMQNTRIEEGFEIAFESADPCAGHTWERTHRRSCGNPHGITIAKLKRSRGKWKIEGQFKQPSARK
ncbi:MAG: hypothetical protein LAO31_14120 [Acidobacteriia bacterium]|nr:hypothetical protein [Terriglobia bacterium]